MKKYELIPDQRIKRFRKTLYRIRACINIYTGRDVIKAGTLGGWIEKEENLAQSGCAWVYDNAKVYGNARVQDSAGIYDNAKVYGNARVQDSACIYGNAKVQGNAKVYGNACVYGRIRIRGNAEIKE